MPKIVQGLRKIYSEYTTIDSIDEIEKLCKTKKNCYISYYGDEIHKLYIDVDLYEDAYSPFGEFELMKIRVLKDIKNAFNNFRLSIAESHNNKKNERKISYRVIVNDLKIKISEMEDFLLDNYKDDFEYNIVDPKVYSSGGKVRLPYCSKDGENRPLNIIMGEFKDFITSNVEQAEMRTCEKLYTIETIQEKSKELYNELNNDEIKEILFCLPSDYYDKYEKWFKIGAICKTLNDYNLFNDFSKQSSKYNEQAVIKYWNQFKPNKYNVNSLFYFLRIDNPTKFNELSERKSYFYSHYDTARLFYRLKPDSYLYSKVLKWFVLQSNNTWSREEEQPSELINDIANTITNYYSKIINSLDKSNEKQLNKIMEISKFLKNCIHSDKFTGGVSAFLKSMYTVKSIERIMDENRNLIAFNNGVYDLEKSEFRPIQPKDYISHTTNYDLNMKSDNKSREEIMTFIKSCFAHNDDVEYLLKTIAYGLSGNNKLEEFYIWTGKGGNGKGTINDLLRRSLTESYYDTQSMDIFTKTNRYANQHDTLGSTKGRRYLIATEPDTKGGEVFNMAKLNLMTGNDTITTRGAYEKAIQFIPQFTIYMQCNDIPDINSVEQSIKRRIRIINFPYNFVDTVTDATFEREKDSNLKNKIKYCNLWRNEFMLLLLEYYKNHILNCDSIKQPASVQSITNEYLDDNNKIKTWINDNYDKTEEDTDRIINTTLYDNYIYDTRDNVKRKQFYNLLLAIGMKSKPGANNSVVYTKLKKKSTPPLIN
jgi:P4 family phage/plasmid primase-like protien